MEGCCSEVFYNGYLSALLLINFRLELAYNVIFIYEEIYEKKKEYTREDLVHEFKESPSTVNRIIDKVNAYLVDRYRYEEIVYDFSNGFYIVRKI